MLRIRDWDKHFENAASRKLHRLDWVAVPNKMDGSGYTALVDHPNGAAHLGAWYAIVEIASRQKPRGNLPDPIGGICQCLGRISRLPADVFAEVLPRLLEIGWIEEVSLNQYSPNASAESPNASAESCVVKTSQSRAARARQSENQSIELSESKESATTLAESATSSADCGSTGKGNRKRIELITSASLGTQSSKAPEPPPPTVQEIKAELHKLAAQGPGNGKPTNPEAEKRLQVYETAKKWLREFPDNERLPGNPDDVIITKCLDLCNWDVELLVSVLRRAAHAGKRPSISWAWFPTIVKQYTEAKES